jgi:hypothetical protein
MSDKALKTPIEDLLRAIPIEHVIQFETDDNGFKAWHNCPVGREAHEAADLIDFLRHKVSVAADLMQSDRKEIDRLNAALSEATAAGLLQAAAIGSDVTEPGYSGYESPHTFQDGRDAAVEAIRTAALKLTDTPKEGA